jgi:hypothetical protein
VAPHHLPFKAAQRPRPHAHLLPGFDPGLRGQRLVGVDDELGVYRRAPSTASSFHMRFFSRRDGV